ncbi:MAG: hypothetical protein U5J95_12480 [Balneolaceae bacterium]|nr:hypothetical protein [Balneolaceae bacterium]
MWINSDKVVLTATNLNLETNKLDFSELKYLKDDFDLKEDKIVKKGSLLICLSSGAKSHLGKVALVDEDYGYFFGGFIGRITPNEDLRKS